MLWKSEEFEVQTKEYLTIGTCRSSVKQHPCQYTVKSGQMNSRYMLLVTNNTSELIKVHDETQMYNLQTYGQITGSKYS